MFIFLHCRPNCENLSARLITGGQLHKNMFGVSFSDTSMHLYLWLFIAENIENTAKVEIFGHFFFLRSTEFEQIRIIVSVSVSTLIFCIYVTHTNWLVCVCVLGGTCTNTPYIQHTTNAN